MKFISKMWLAAALMGTAFTCAADVPKDGCARYSQNPKVGYLLDPSPSSIEGSIAHVFKSKEGVDLRLHVFYPPDFDPSRRPAAEKLPAIVFFFGGAWMVGAVTQMVPPARYLAGRNMIAVVADYRVFCRNKVSIVDEMADAKSAIRWLRGHAEELGIDPHRIVASGQSSGGHIALSTAMFKHLDEPAEDRTISSKPDLLALFYPCVDETTDEERSYGGDAIGAHAKDVSPLYHIGRHMPPMMILQGTADTLYSENKSYCAQARAKGNRCDFVEYQGAPHGFFAPGVEQGKWYSQSLRELEGFLIKAGYLRIADEQETTTAAPPE